MQINITFSLEVLHGCDMKMDKLEFENSANLECLTRHA